MRWIRELAQLDPFSKCNSIWSTLHWNFFIHIQTQSSKLKLASSSLYSFSFTYQLEFVVTSFTIASSFHWLVLACFTCSHLPILILPTKYQFVSSFYSKILQREAEYEAISHWYSLLPVLTLLKSSYLQMIDEFK